MIAIAAIDENWGIGCAGQLLFQIPQDMRFFREMTLGKVVVMGHCTLKSLPGGKALAGRVNIVLSRNAGLIVESAIVCGSLEQLLSVLSGYNPDDVFVIGGQQVYTLLLPHCTGVLLTKIESTLPADSHFPRLGSDWVLISQSQRKQHAGLSYTFCRYAKK